MTKDDQAAGKSHRRIFRRNACKCKAKRIKSNKSKGAHNDAPYPQIFLGWDHYIEDVWWSRFRQQQAKRRGSKEEAENDLSRTVPTEYYSRHQLLKPGSPNYILPPQGQKGSTPVYTYRPGTTTTQLEKSWPTRAHDGSMEQKPTSRRESVNSPEVDSI